MDFIHLVLCLKKSAHTLMLSSRNLIVLHFFIYVCDPFQVNFCERYKVYIMIHFLAVISTPFAEETIFTPLYCFCSFAKHQLTILSRSFSGLSSVPLIFLLLLLFFCQYHPILITIASWNANVMAGTPADLLDYEVMFKMQTNYFQ